MRVLVVGAAGFVGGHVARAFADHGDEVVGLVPRPPRPDDARLTKVHLVLGRVEAPPQEVRARRFDVLVHAGGVWKPGTRLPLAEIERRCRAVYVEGTRRLAEMAARDGSHVVMVTGVVRYGAFPPGTPLTRETPPSPSPWPYGPAKVAAERVLAESGVRWSAPCAPIVFGPHDVSSYVWSVYRSLRSRGFAVVIGDGSAGTALCGVHTLASAVVRLGEGSGVGLVLVADEPQVTHADLAVRVAEAMRVPSRVVRVPAEALRVVSRVAHAVPGGQWLPPLPTPREIDFRTRDFPLDLEPGRALGLVGAVPLEQRIDEAVRWWREQGS